jgi:hypothetical protein
MHRCVIALNKRIGDQLKPLAIHFYVLRRREAEVLDPGAVFGRKPSARMTIESIRRFGGWAFNRSFDLGENQANLPSWIRKE